MARTDRDIASKALALLGVSHPNAEASGEDYAVASDDLTALYAELDDIHEMGLGLVSNNIPEALYLPLANAVAGRIAMEFELPSQRFREAMGLRKLRAYAANEVRTNQPSHIEVF